MASRIPADDDRARAMCTQCGFVHYLNPKVVVGCIPERDNKILLCKRNIEPQKGLWTLPAGYLENNETVQDGAVRETYEETNARVGIISCYRMYNIVHVSQIYLMFRANMLSEMFSPTKESIDVRLFDQADIPWDKIAFKVIKETLADYFNDRETGSFLFRIKDIHPDKISG